MGWKVGDRAMVEVTVPDPDQTRPMSAYLNGEAVSRDVFRTHTIRVPGRESALGREVAQVEVTGLGYTWTGPITAMRRLERS